MTVTYDRPRRSGENVVDWALATRRVGASRADQYRTMLASGSVTESFVEALASPLPTKPSDVKASQHLVSGMRQRLNLPPTAGRDQILAALEAVAGRSSQPDLSPAAALRIRERLNLPATASHAAVLAAIDRLPAAPPRTAAPVAAAVRQRFAAAAATSAAPTGVDPGLAPHFAANPMVESIAVSEPVAFDQAVAFRPTPPTLFASGDLPTYTASGLDPAELTRVPWYARHAVAAAAALEDAQALIAFYGGTDGVAMAAETRRHQGNRDYEARVWEWAGAGEEAAELAEQGTGASARPGAGSVGMSAFWGLGDGDTEVVPDEPVQQAGSTDQLLMDAWAQQLGVDSKELSV